MLRVCGWLTFSGPLGVAQDRERSVIAKASAPVNLVWAAQLLKNLHFSNIVAGPGAPATPSVYGAGLFNTTTLRNGRPVCVGVLVRLDGNAKRGLYRMIIRAQAPKVAAAVKAVAGPQLGEVQA